MTSTSGLKKHIKNLILLGLSLFCSCLQSPTLNDQDQSFRQYENQLIQGQNIDQYLLLRTALVMNGKSPIHSSAYVSGNSWVLDHGNAQSAGVACAISPDGYFISAAHVTEKKEAEMIYISHQGPVSVPVRIVDEIKSHDLVVLHAPIRTSHYFPLNDNQLRSGHHLISGGMGINNNSAGQLIVSRTDRAALENGDKVNIHILKSNLPIKKGDSGGPLIDEQGYLRGINSLVSINFIVKKDPISYHVFPSLQWIQSTIEKDRKEQSLN
jgi:S1-C subfamily serine protease